MPPDPSKLGNLWNGDDAARPPAKVDQAPVPAAPAAVPDDEQAFWAESKQRPVFREHRQPEGPTYEGDAWRRLQEIARMGDAAPDSRTAFARGIRKAIQKQVRQETKPGAAGSAGVRPAGEDLAAVVPVGVSSGVDPSWFSRLPPAERQLLREQFEKMRRRAELRARLRISGAQWLFEAGKGVAVILGIALLQVLVFGVPAVVAAWAVGLGAIVGVAWHVLDAGRFTGAAVGTAAYMLGLLPLLSRGKDTDHVPMFIGLLMAMILSGLVGFSRELRVEAGGKTE
ncbi:MAG TPA: hypothetical protein VK348_01605 [Planctomycetota bacterium]|nr:hypothetical protein [Planctomycetota bacterium]